MLFDKSVFFLWPDGIQHNYVLLFLSNAVPHMIKAGAVIKKHYTRKLCTLPMFGSFNAPNCRGILR